MKPFDAVMIVQRGHPCDGHIAEIYSRLTADLSTGARRWKIRCEDSHPALYHDLAEMYLAAAADTAPKVPPLDLGTRVGIEHRDWPDRIGYVRGFNPATGKYEVELKRMYPGDRDGGSKIWLGRGALAPIADPGQRRTLRIEIPLEEDEYPDTDPIALIDLLAERHDRLEATIWKDRTP